MSDNDENDVTYDSQAEMSAEADGSDISRVRARARLAADIEAFLSQGGQIQEVTTTGWRDAPRKAESGYSSDIL